MNRTINDLRNEPQVALKSIPTIGPWQSLQALQNDWSQHLFGIPFARNPGTLRGLSDEAKGDINLGLSDLKVYTDRHQVAFSTSGAGKTVALAKSVLPRLLRNLTAVAEILKTKVKQS